MLFQNLKQLYNVSTGKTYKVKMITRNYVIITLSNNTTRWISKKGLL